MEEGRIPRKEESQGRKIKEGCQGRKDGKEGRKSNTLREGRKDHMQEQRKDEWKEGKYPHIQVSPIYAYPQEGRMPMKEGCQGRKDTKEGRIPRK